MFFLPSLFYTFLLTTLIKLTSQQTTVCNPLNRPTTCGYDYTPVCSFPTGCNDYTCTYTSRNACNACQSTAVAYYINGACPQDSIGGDTDSGDTDSGNSDAGGTETELETEIETETGTGTGGIEPGNDGNSTNTTIPDGTNSTNNTDIDTNSTTNSTNGSGSSTGNNTDSGTGSTPSTPGNGTDAINSTNSTNSTSNNTNTDTTTPDTTIPCADYGAMIKASGKIVLGALCCGSEPVKCPKTSPQVCGVLTNCIGDVCRKTYKNYCKACHDNTTSVQLYLNAPCETLFGLM